MTIEDAPLLEVRNLHVHFFTFAGVTHAVNGVSLSLKSGEIVGVVGETGCGKSVLVRSILGLIGPPGKIVAGQILFNGVDLLSKDEEELQKIRGKEIALIVPNPRSVLDPVRRVGDQIVDVIMAHNRISRPDALARALQLMEAVGIPDPPIRRFFYPHELSGGMCQRIVIAMALANAPRLLLADEPTTGLDVTIQIQILDLIRDLVRRLGSAALLVTRDLSVVAHYCDRVAVMHEGQIVESAEVDAFFERSVHPYSLALLRAAYRARGVQQDRE